MNGFKLIRQGPTSTSQIVCNHGLIDYSPDLKFRVEKKNAFDPTIIHQREPYHEDAFRLTIMISPLQYRELLNILAQAGNLYLLYTSAGIDLEFRVTIEDYPPCPDNLHEYPSQTSLKLISRYLSYTSVINPEIQELTAFDEILIIDDAPPIGTT